MTHSEAMADKYANARPANSPLTERELEHYGTCAACGDLRHESNLGTCAICKREYCRTWGDCWGALRTYPEAGISVCGRCDGGPEFDKLLEDK